MKNNHTYRAEVREVYSGDDMLLMIDLDIDGLYKKVRVRLHGVDTPDGWKAGVGSDAGNIRDLVRSMVYRKDCYIQVVSYGKGGWIVDLFVRESGSADGYTCINKVLIDMGYVFSSDRKQGRCQQDQQKEKG